MRKRATQIRESQQHAPSAAALHPRPRAREKGYVLLTLLLLVALMAVVAMGVIIPIQAEYQREQETEMIHRGVQYSRAIKNYYKKFQRYPTKLEDLDNTNNMRYLRKHYKDPLNCKNGKCQDFRLLHYGEPGVTLGGGFSIGGGSIPGASAVGSPAGQSSFGGNSSSFGNSGSGSSFGNSSFGGSGSSSGFGNSGFGNSGVNSSGVFSQSSGSGNSNGGFGASSNSQTGPGQQGTDQQGSGQQGANSASGSDSSQTPQAPGGQGDANAGGQQLVASGPIVGVASLCKKNTIREYNHKKKYNEWQFLYDPSLDHGGIITTPYQPSLQAFGAQQNLNGAQPAGGTSSSPFGSTNGSPFGNSNSSSFGNSNGSSFGQSSSFGNSGSSSSPSQPPANPPQQQ
jgi:type II secretory pathway pseudopilin PulG